MARNPRKHTQVDMSMPPIRFANIAPLVHIAVLIEATTAVWPEPPYGKKRSASCAHVVRFFIASETQWRWSTKFLCSKKEGEEDRIHRRQDLLSAEVLPPGTASGEPVEKRYFYFRIFAHFTFYDPLDSISYLEILPLCVMSGTSLTVLRGELKGFSSERDTIALRAVEDALEREVATRKLSIAQLQLTNAGIERMETCIAHFQNARRSERESREALTFVLKELHDALDGDEGTPVDLASSSVSDNRAKGVSMVAQLVAARDRALQTQSQHMVVPSLTPGTDISQYGLTNSETVDRSFSATKSNLRLSKFVQAAIQPDERCSEHATKTNSDFAAQTRLHGDENSSSVMLTTLYSNETTLPSRVSLACGSGSLQSESSSDGTEAKFIPRVSADAAGTPSQIFDAVQRISTNQNDVDEIMELVMKIEASRISAENSLTGCRAQISALHADVRVAWEALTSLRSTPTRGSVEGFAEELESLLREKDAATLAISQLTEDKQRAMKSASQVTEKLLASDGIRMQAEAELATMREQVQGLQKHIRELADLNQKSRQQLAAERSRSQRFESECAHAHAREEKDRRRFALLQAEVSELRNGLTRRVRQVNRSALLTKRAYEELAREKASQTVLRARERELELKVCELADALAANQDDIKLGKSFSTLVANSSGGTPHHDATASREVELLVQELAREEMRARKRADEAEKIAASALSEVKALKEAVGIN
jgi:hypothetical protein